METTTKFTRAQYLNQECTHEQYYNQFVTPAIKSLVKNSLGLDKLKEAYEAGESLNTIPLTKWDSMSQFIGKDPYFLNVPMKEVGDFLTLAGIVCIAKAAARQLINE